MAVAAAVVATRVDAMVVSQQPQCYEKPVFVSRWELSWVIHQKVNHRHDQSHFY